MTEKHGDRVNGESFFTVESLTLIMDNLEYSMRRENDPVKFEKTKESFRACNRELDYLKAIKVK